MGFSVTFAINKPILVDIDQVRNTLKKENISSFEVVTAVQSLANGCTTTKDVFDKIESIRDLIPDLKWETYADITYDNRPFLIWAEYDGFTSVSAYGTLETVSGPAYQLEGGNIPQPQQ